MIAAPALLVLAIMAPATGVVLAFAFGGRAAEWIAIATTVAGAAIAAGIAATLWSTGLPLRYVIGDWAPPLGIALRADGLSAIMLLTSAVVMGAVVLFARETFAQRPGAPETRTPLIFWTMLMGVWAGLNAVWLAGDLFTLYVALELLTFSAVPLVSLEGKPETLVAALRYMLFALVGSVLYLLGCALLYGGYGTLDLELLAHAVRAEPVTVLAAALMTAGLAAKTALFPLHLWLPPAHAGAPAAASALLSALVVKGSFILIVRLWFDALPGVAGAGAATLLAAMGAAAIICGSIVALRQARLKLMIAYSTVAQIGYLFFLFPLAGAAGHWSRIAWTGGMMQLVAHAVAKAAMFLAAGLIGEALGHDRIAGFAGLGRALPVVMLAFGLAGMSLMGLPPSGGFVAKAMLLTASVGEGQWWWAVVILIGGLLAAGYTFRVLAPALAGGPVPLVAPIPRSRQAIVLGLAVCALLLGLVPLRPSQLLEVGRPVAMAVSR
ncbi:complex I subunit 5 family protein [Rhodopila globiformis]|uniref:NADH-quinone oxidoreductase subunit J n=1 Tax=Rhodopila globiformis TaxID=1071 RepID=A0A2S6NGZ1_RHOGL|nr:proton-conducting transporter membrane subunit [Rhodopila globiformis]PPQ33902.1 NADH-quinone oxidoreductase subunit J [Rhodopila globiformis]